MKINIIQFSSLSNSSTSFIYPYSYWQEKARGQNLHFLGVFGDLSEDDGEELVEVGVAPITVVDEGEVNDTSPSFWLSVFTEDANVLTLSLMIVGAAAVDDAVVVVVVVGKMGVTSSYLPTPLSIISDGYGWDRWERIEDEDGKLDLRLVVIVGVLLL